ncbi:hypothetical protein M422DRAFT_248263 [Sphaerobolus stellatus SS14]|uniref:Uncharacterized protein n=1 Tax=Sphaerobolus stellatus (strain SS14) TaxID=990650 RepID=A0A0C9VWF5_SPHS4|nr:hypothetical protein M422DRAFT_248263 [Sphaerobolus stellatus SS14]
MRLLAAERAAVNFQCGLYCFSTPPRPHCAPSLPDAPPPPALAGLCASNATPRRPYRALHRRMWRHLPPSPSRPSHPPPEVARSSRLCWPPRGVFRVDCDTPTLPSRSPLPKAAAASRVPALPLRSLAVPNAAGDTQGGLRLQFNPSASLSGSPTWDLAATSYVHLPAPPAHPLRLLAAPKAAGSTQRC